MTTLVLLNMSNLPSNSDDTAFRPKQWEWRKPKDKPRRNLSAYNYFFAETRKQLIDDRLNAQMRGAEPITDPSELGFSGLARTVAARWKALEGDTKARFTAMAEQDRDRYKRELAVWNSKNDGTDTTGMTTQPTKAAEGAAQVKPSAHRKKEVANQRQRTAVDRAKPTAVVDLTAATRAVAAPTLHYQPTAYKNEPCVELPNTSNAFDELKCVPRLASMETRMMAPGVPYSFDNVAVGSDSTADNLDDRKHAATLGPADSPPDKKVRLSHETAPHNGMRHDLLVSTTTTPSTFAVDYETYESELLAQYRSSAARGEFSHWNQDRRGVMHGDDVSTALLEPLSLNDEINAPMSRSDSSTQETGNSGAKSPGNQSPSTVDRLLSVLNKEDCDLLVRRFSA